MIKAPPALDVTALGRFEIRRHQHPLSGGNWNRRKVCDLFKLLLSTEQHRLHREQVQEILWPSSTSEQAANSFGKTLYLLRRAFEPDLATGKGSLSTYVTLDHDTLMLVPDSMKIDADLFEASAKQLQVKMRNSIPKEEQERGALLDEFDAVLSLYGGDYLPEELYEDWAQRRRDRIRRVYSWLLENAAELAVANMMGKRSCEYLQTLLEQNSADEQTHRQLMLIYARMGRRSDALNQYQLLREALKEELRANPLSETLELYRTIQAGRIQVDLAEPQRRVGSGSPGAANVNTADLHVHVHAKTDIYSPSEVPHSSHTTIAQEARRDLDPEPLSPSQIDPERILKAALVGREEEMQRLQRAHAQVRIGQQRVFFISGEPGIGKTRLARECAQWAEETQQAVVLWGYCYEMSGLLPYQPIIDAISAHIRTCNPEQLRRMLGDSAVDLAKITPELRAKLPDLSHPEPQGAEVERRNLYNAVARYFNALASERPVTIILDDLQWADTATMQLLGYLTSQSASSIQSATPFYLLLYRADEVHEAHPLRGFLATLARLGTMEEIHLKRLKEDSVQQLLMNIAGHCVRPLFSSEIYKHTEGNPFFIGEAIRSLIQEGKIKKVGEHWQTTVELDKLELPQSVRLLIERRLVHLTPECRTTLTLAAVLGRQFSSALLCQARNLSEDVVAEHIDEAIQAQILMPLNGIHAGEDDLAFTHDKIREFLSQWLNPLRRRALHRQVAQAIEARYASHLQPYYSNLAWHYQVAEDSTRAVDYFVKSAWHAANVYAFVDAAGCMEKALELLIGDEERARRAELLRQLSVDIYLYTGRLDKAIEAGMASCALWRDLGNGVKEAEARLDVAFSFHWQGRESDALEYVKRALDCLTGKPEETRLLARTYIQWGMAATIMGETPIALEKLQRADELHTQIGGTDPFITVVSLWARSWRAFLAESPRQMLDYALRGVEVCRSTRRFGWEPMMTYSAAWAQMLLGNLTESERTAHDALEKAQRHNAVGSQAWAYLVLAFLTIQKAQWDEAKQFGDKAFAIATLLHDANLQARVLWSRSVYAGWHGDWEGAIQEISEALQLARREGETSMIYPHLLVQAAKACFYAGKIERAQFYLDQAMQLAQDRHYRQLPAIGQRLQGRILQAQGKFDAAQPYFEQSLAALAALDDIVEYARTQEAYGQFYLARRRAGDAERSQSLIDAARATFRRLGVNG